MRIAKSPKRLNPLPVSLNTLIQQLSIPESSLVDLLSPFVTQHDSSHPWNYSKTDLFHWIPILNRMDAFLGDMVSKYSLPNQKNPFEANDKNEILVVLAFTRVLWENSTNRALYSSYDHLTSFLGTTDLNVLLAVLKMVYRPAQRIASTRSLKSTFGPAQDAITTLALSWSPFLPGEATLLELATSTHRFPADKSISIQYNFFRSDASSESLQSPTTTNSGWISIAKPLSEFQNLKDYEILEKLIEEYQVPVSHRLPLLNRIRVALALESQPEQRFLLLACRFYSIAILSNLVTEEVLQQKIFLAQADFINQLADLLAISDGSIDQEVSTSALAALDSIAHYRTFMGRVLAALGATTNYGTLMRLCRQAISTMESKSSSATNADANLSTDFLEILFSFLSFISTTPNGANMLIGSGLIPCILSSLSVDNPIHIRNVVRCINILDTTLYNYPTSFNSFMAAQGLDLVIDRIDKDIQDVIETALNSQGQILVTKETPLPLDPLSSPEIGHLCNRVPLLRANVKFVLHLMQSNGSAEGLRSLIDSKLPGLVGQVFAHSHLFGILGILGLAMNIMSAFVHNEPTTLPILQESGIPKAFLDSVLRDPVPVSAEVISAIPNAFGAICLNQAGLDHFLEVKPMPSFLEVFISEEHARVLQDNDVPHLIGNSVDEFIRHHPSVKQHVIESIIVLLDKVVNEAKEAKPEDWEMIELISHEHHLAKSMSDKEESHDASKVSLLVDVTSRFLEGLFQNTSHCKEFLKMDGALKLLQLLSLPTLSLDFSTSMSSYSLSYLFRVMVEVSAKEFAPLMRKEIENCMNELSPLFSRFSSSPSGSLALLQDKKVAYRVFEEYISLSTDSAQTAQRVFRALMKLQNITRLFSDLYFTHSLSHARGVNSIIALFVPEEQQQDHDAIVSGPTPAGRIRLRDINTPLVQVPPSGTSDVSTSDATPKATPDNGKEPSQPQRPLMDMFGDMYRSCLVESILLSQSAPRSWIEPKPKEKSGEIRELKNTNADLTRIGDANMSPVSVDAEAGPASAVVDVMDQDPPASSSGADEKKTVERAKEKNTRAFAFLFKEITGSLSSVFKGILKQVGTRRRITDAEVKKGSLKVMEQLASTGASFLTYSSTTLFSDSTGVSLDLISFQMDYLRDVLSLLGSVFIDERSGSALHTSFFLAFEKVNGLDLVFSTFNSVLDTLTRLQNYKSLDDEETKRAEDIFSRGLKVIASCLNNWQVLTNHKSIHDSPYTTALVGNARNRALSFVSGLSQTDPDTFDSYLFLRKMRIRCYPFLYRIWRIGSTSQEDGSISEDTVAVGRRLWKDETVFKYLSKMILQYLDTQGEVNPVAASGSSSSAAGAAIGANGLPSALSSLAASIFGRQPVNDPANNPLSAEAATNIMTSLLNGTLGAPFPPPASAPVDGTRVAQLEEMGFPRPAAELALRRCGNHLERAADYLLTHPEVVASATFSSTTGASSSSANAEAPVEGNAAASSSSANPSNSENQVTSNVESQPADMSISANDHDGDEDMEEASEDDDDDQWEDADDDEDENNNTSTDRPPTDAELEARSKEKGKEIAEKEENKEFAPEVLTPLRDQLKSSLLPICLEVIDQSSSHIFHIKDLIVRADDLEKTTSIVFEEIDKLREQIGPITISNRTEKKPLMDALGNRVRLLASILTDATSSTSKTAVRLIQDNEYLKSLLNLLLIPLPAISADGDLAECEKLGISSTGLASLLLLLESYVSVADEPTKVPFKYSQDNNSSFGIFSTGLNKNGSNKDESDLPSDEKQKSESLSADAEKKNGENIGPNLSQDDRVRLLERLVYLLGTETVSSDADISHSILRLLVRLTRRREIALHFATQTSGLKTLFQSSLIASFPAQPHLTICILRHIIESESILLEAVEREIHDSFTSLRAKSMDLASLLRVNAHLIVRDPDAFVKAAGNLIKFGSSSSSLRTRMLVLKDSQKTLTGDDENESQENVQAQGSSSANSTNIPKTPVCEKTALVLPAFDTTENQSVREEIISFLTSEIVQLKSQPLNVQLPPQPSSQDLAETLRLASETKLAHVRRCFVLQCLTELAMSYPACRISILHVTQRRHGSHSAATPSSTFTTPIKPSGGKLRNSFLAHLLLDLLPKPIESPEDTKQAAKDPSSRGLDVRMKTVESNITQSFLCALCLGSTRYDADEQTQMFPELDSIRKSVLDWILKAFRDTVNNDNLPLEKKSERWYAYGQLINHILLVKSTSTSVNGQNGAQISESHQIHLARLMLEKSFVSVITNIISGFDLHHPMTKVIAAGLITPLNTLTNLAIKMGKSGDTVSYSPRASESKRVDNVQITRAQDTASGLSTSADQTPATTPSRVQRPEENLVEDEEEDLLIPADQDTASDNEISEIYRNSALGMFHPNQGFSDADGNGLSDEDEDDEDDDIEFDDEEGESIDEDMGEQDSEEDDDMEIVVPQPYHGPVVHNDDISDEESSASDDPDVIHEDDVDEEQIMEMQWTDDDDEDDEDQSASDGDDASGDDDDDAEEADEADDLPLPNIADAFDQALNGFPNRAGRDGFGADMDDDDEGSYDSMSEGDDDLVEDFELENGNLVGAMPIGQAPRAGREIFHLDVAPERVDTRWPGMDLQAGGSGFSYLEELLGGPPRGSGGNFELLSRPLAASGSVGGAGGADTNLTRHPLLSPQANRNGPANNLSVPSFMQGGTLGSTSMNGVIDLRSAGEDSRSNAMNALRILEEIFGRNRMGNDRLRIETRTATGRHGQEIIATIDGDPSELDRLARAMRQTNQVRSRGSVAASNPDDSNLSSLDSHHDIAIIHSFAPQFSAGRWKFEAKLLYGPNYSSKSSWVHNSLLNLLIPPAKEEDRIRKEKQKKKEEEAALKRAKEEEERKAKAAAEEAERKKKLEEEAVAKAAEEERLRIEKQEAEQENPATITSTESASAGPSNEPRVVITIHGNPVDITGTGIDITFLEALPDDLRQEVVTNHLRDMRQSTTRTSAPTPSADIFSEEFLNALPEEIRREVVQQDEAARNRVAGATETSGGPSDIDLASFLASLDPSLRQQVLMEQDETLLTSLPSELLAEANAVRTRSNYVPFPSNPVENREASTSRDGAVTTGSTTQPRGQKRPQSKPSSPPSKRPREAVQLLDRPGVVSILRLIFVQEQDDLTVVHDILNNLCANSKSRYDLVSLLLAILSHDSHDLAAVDRNFAKLSIRNQKSRASLSGGIPATPGPISSTSNASVSASGTSSYVEDAPNLVILRALSALTHLVTSSPLVVQFFLKERLAEETTLKTPKSSRKKGKERASIGGSNSVQGTLYLPLSSLLNLLEKPKYLQDPSILEQLMNLLATVCRRLSALAKRHAILSAPKELSKKSSDQAESKKPTADKIIGQVSVATSSSSELSHEDEPLAKLSGFVTTTHVRLVCNVLKDGVCSSKSFQYTLYVLQTLSLLPGKIDVITQELKDSIAELCTQLAQELDELFKITSTAQSGSDVEGQGLIGFSSPASIQARLLRLLKTVDFLHYKSNAISIPASTTASSGASSSGLDKDHQGSVQEKASHEKLSSFYNQIGFGSVWASLGANLAEIEQKEHLTHISTVLLPLIESFMVVAKPFVFVKKSNHLEPQTKSYTMSRTASLMDTSQDTHQDAFVSFTEAHKKLLNIMVRNNPSLMNGSFSLLVHNPKVLEFDNKRTYFKQQLHKKKDRQHHAAIPINVRRQYVFEDSYHQLQGRRGDEIKFGKLAVRFHEEEGLDAGGVTREWFSALARQMFNPDYALFRPSAADKVTYQPNRASGINPDHLSFFKFVGRIIGKAIYDGRLLDAYFTRSFYKCILELQVDYKDIEAVDPEYHKSLVWILNNDITDILDLTFSVELDDFGKRRVIDLKPDGKDIPVTEENKVEYVKLISEQRLVLAIKDQIQAFLSGFNEIIPKDLIKIFNEQELELLISGLPDIDVDDWKNNTEYVSYTSSSPVIQWFWRAVRSFSQEERAKLIQFVTGTSKVPLEGFARLQGSSGVQKFQIHKDFSSNERLPSAHTCFNQLDLPEYESYDQLRSYLLKAISECSTGFGFA